jgi:acetyl esterase/lipase
METTPLWPGQPPGSMPGQPQPAPELVRFPVQGRERAPAVLVLPGGGYTQVAEHEGAPVARWLNSIGLAAFVLRYRVAPYRHPVPLIDAQRAMRQIRAGAASWGVDPARVAALGFSAGGHLAATLATADAELAALPGEDAHSSRPDALVLCYPVISFGPHRHDGSLRALLGDDAPTSGAAALSAELRVGPTTPPAFLWHTADDEAVPLENSLLFASALRAHGVSFALHVFPHGPHGLGLADELPGVGRWKLLCADWFEQKGWR